MAKMGRPPKQEGQPRNNQMTLTMTDGEKKLLEEKSAKLKKSRTDTIIAGLKKL